MTDPTLQEEGEERFGISTDDKAVTETNCISIGYLPASEQISCLLQEGCSDPKTLISDIDHLKSVCSDLLPNVTTCLVESVKLCAQSEMEKL